MGDYRFSFTAKFSMGDVEDKCDMWLNYSPHDGSSIDHRVLEWLEKQFEAGQSSISEEMIDAAQESQKQEEEKAGRAEYERLKAKYDK